jgi:hypothetical protein
MTKAIRLFASISLILLFMNFGNGKSSQGRSNFIQAEGQREASKFWTKSVAACGGSHYIKRTHAIFEELRGFQIVMRYDSLTEADQLNGIQANCLTGYTATSYRSYQNEAWRQWENGGPTLINSVRFQKVGGRWSFQPVIYYDKVGEIISCVEVPGFRSAASKEIPLNAIDLDDSRRLPIGDFSFWDSNTNLSGDKFPKSTTTFVNWRIFFSTRVL